jgi:hypothetical protein
LALHLLLKCKNAKAAGGNDQTQLNLLIIQDLRRCNQTTFGESMFYGAILGVTEIMWYVYHVY